MNKIQIIKLDHSYTNQIENIWKESLPHNLKSMIGNEIIHEYLTVFLNSKNTLGVGLSLNNQLKGFVFYGNDKSIIKNVIKKKFYIIIKSFLKTLLKFDLKKILNYINCTFFLILALKEEKKLLASDTELLIICISKSEQGKKYGSILLEKSLNDFFEYFNSYNNIFVKTLKKDQQNIFFYQKNNFKIFFEIFGRVYLKFIYKTNI